MDSFVGWISIFFLLLPLLIPILLLIGSLLVFRSKMRRSIKSPLLVTLLILLILSVQFLVEVGNWNDGANMGAFRLKIIR